MKNFNILMFVLGFVFSPLLVKADTIGPNEHPMIKCVKIVNLSEFTDISVLSSASGPMLRSDEISVVKNNECIDGGYKFNKVSVYWTTNDKLNSIDKSKLLINNLDWFGGTVGNGNPLTKETVEYSLVKMNNKYNLYKTKITSEYNDGKPAKVQNFNIPSPENQKEIKNIDQNENQDINENNNIPVKKGFWKKVGCFFGFIRTCNK